MWSVIEYAHTLFQKRVTWGRDTTHSDDGLDVLIASSPEVGDDDDGTQGDTETSTPPLDEVRLIDVD